MKFSIGDNIILKRTDEEGVVSAYINEQMLEVEVKGVKFPVYNDDIDHPYFKWFTDSKKVKKITSLPEQLPVEKDKFKKPKLARGVYLSFLPEYKADVFEDEVQNLKIYLLNELPHAIYFQYKVLNNQQHILFQHEAKLFAFGDVYLHTIPFDVMNEQPRFYWEVADADNTSNASHEDVLRVKPQKLFEHISNMLLKNEPTFSYLLVDEFKPKKKEEKLEVVTIEKEKVKTVGAKDWKASLPRFEIDLHIEELTDNTRGLTNTDKLQIQLNALQRYLHDVISNRQERVMIIHGLGKGVLRDEVHKALRQIPEVSKFSNDWNGQYGFGATEVWFKY